MHLLPLLLVAPPLLTLAASLSTTTKPPRGLTGRFLHLTDIHPDPFYRYGAAEASACHFDKPSKGPRAGYWGTSVSDCDTPLNLVNATFDWLSTHLRGEVDFIVWTGDNARHDIDSALPRSLPEIFQSNTNIAERIRDTFGDIPVVASIGNNDIYPHNIMFAGPSTITTQFSKIWSDFIPEDQQHNFARGGYYAIDAIPDSLILISLNTLYFYDSNKAVDGCPPYKGFSADIDPGTEQLLWLEQQLIIARERGSQVWLTGHVPPSRANWYEGCYLTYGDLMLSFHDTIVGNLFGHMNIDHFTFIDASDVLPSSPSRRPRSLEVSPIFSTTSGPDDLRGQYKSLPKAKKTNWSDFAVVHVNPSVIPTYLPTVRLWSYNVSREEDGGWRQKVEDGDRRINGSQLQTVSREPVGEWATYDEEDDDEDDSNDDQCELDSSPSPPPSLLRFLSLPSFLPSLFPSLFPSLPHTLKKKKHHHHHRRPTPHRPRYYSPLSPSCTNQFLTPLGYTQFFIDLDTYNENSGYGAGEVGKRLLEEGGEKGVRPGLGYEVEYTTFEASALAQGLEGGRGAVPRSLLPGSVLEVLDSEEDGPTKRGKLEAAIEGEGWVSYGMKDLTIGSWLEMGRKLGRSKKAWKLFEKRMYVGMGP